MDPAKNELVERVKSFPTEPGVYLMKNRDGTVIYVGKAVNLRSRVKSYFQQDGDGRLLVPFLVAKVAAIDFIATHSSKEALILEHQLIREHKPRYNVVFKDDKSYLGLKIDKKHPFPTISTLRMHKQPLAAQGQYGPFASAKALRSTLKSVHQVFQLRSCTDAEFSRRQRPCLDHQIGRCTAPCCKLVTQEEYAAQVEQTELFLRGKHDALLASIRKQMETAAESLQFEAAARFRDRLKALNITFEEQQVSAAPAQSQDAIGYACFEANHQFVFLSYRLGKLLDKHSVLIKNDVLSPVEILESLLFQYYRAIPAPPERVLLPFPLSGAEDMLAILHSEHGILLSEAKIKLDHAMLSLAEKNAQEELSLRENPNSEDVLASLQARLHLPLYPHIIECFDISNLGDAHFVGSQVVFVDGEATKDLYRSYAIKEHEHQNDFAMMQEVLRRRIKRGVDEQRLPDLLLIDGGKGHLNVAQEVLREFGLIGSIGLCSISKERNNKEEERIHLPNRKNYVTFRPTSPELALLVKLRDEAHRFAGKHQRGRHKRHTFASLLDDIPGLGPKRKALVLQILPAAGKELSMNALQEIPGLPESTARAIFERFAHISDPARNEQQ